MRRADIMDVIDERLVELGERPDDWTIAISNVSPGSREREVTVMTWGAQECFTADDHTPAVAIRCGVERAVLKAYCPALEARPS